MAVENACSGLRPRIVRNIGQATVGFSTPVGSPSLARRTFLMWFPVCLGTARNSTSVCVIKKAAPRA